MTTEQIKVFKELIEAAKPFLSQYTVDLTGGTIPLMNRLDSAVEEAERTIEENK